MTDKCRKYLDMISARIDGELDAGQIEELEAHLKTCPECMEMYRLLASVSKSFGENMTDPGADFTDKVMSAVDGRNIKPAKRALSRKWAGLAACAVIVIALIPIGIGSLRMGGRDGSAASTNSMPRETCYDAAGAPESAQVQMNGYADTEAADESSEKYNLGEPDNTEKSGYSMVVTVYGDVPLWIEENGLQPVTENDDGSVEYAVDSELFYSAAEKYGTVYEVSEYGGTEGGQVLIVVCSRQ